MTQVSNCFTIIEVRVLFYCVNFNLFILKICAKVKMGGQCHNIVAQVRASSFEKWEKQEYIIVTIP